ncbi:hypothetical protein [Streptomyces sp. UNOC14_S4]|uniref:hypothetical protein n=1 Tax=Streptomyces sp. UNOC14_S4 TaxID=2872340 RepID=UPI001E64D6C3|nr:hypothetical protein [Streptomyces sp. UNOC14_S4]MCC3769016.1 hypothetical protein [Streptomyces sp. UNOC14_S4]
MVEQRLPGSIRTRDAVEAHLRAAGIDHGVITTRNRLHYVVLVPPGTSTTWTQPGTWCYGKHSPAPYITAPPPHRAHPPGAYWLLPPPANRTELCHATHVRDVITAATSHAGESRTGS